MWLLGGSDGSWGRDNIIGRCWESRHKAEALTKTGFRFGDALACYQCDFAYVTNYKVGEVLLVWVVLILRTGVTAAGVDLVIKGLVAEAKCHAWK